MTTWEVEFNSLIEQRKYLAKRFADWDASDFPPRLKKAVLDYINCEVVGTGGGASRAGLDKMKKEILADFACSI